MNSESGTRRMFRLPDIPLALFEEICGELGAGEEDLVDGLEDGAWSRSRALDAQHPRVGFKAVVVVRRSNHNLRLELYDQDFFGSGEAMLLEVSSRMHDAGVESIESDLVVEPSKMRFHRDNISLSHPASRLMSFVLLRASEMAHSQGRMLYPYWAAGPSSEVDPE